jgi:GSH-dependent disulfide-bond oxidoreductase
LRAEPTDPQGPGAVEGAARLELYGCMTPNVLKVMLMLGELDLSFRINHVRIYRGENFAEAFETLHPLRKLPVLLDHDGPAGSPHRVFESGAILFYLAEKTGQLFGDGPAQRSVIMQWLMLQMSSVGPVFGNGTHFNRAAPPGEPYARRRFVTQAIRLCELYDTRLRETRYLAGDNFTIADIATFPWLWRHPSLLGINGAAYPHLQQWVSEIRERSGFQRIHARYKQLSEIDMADLATAGPDITDRFLGRGRWFRDGEVSPG